MNVQIFGTKKCNDTKKAERFFKERGIKYQFIERKRVSVVRWTTCYEPTEPEGETEQGRI